MYGMIIYHLIINSGADLDAEKDFIIAVILPAVPSAFCFAGALEAAARKDPGQRIVPCFF